MLTAANKRAFNADKIAALDFIITNGGEFGIAASNLHGRTGYNLSGLSASIALVEKAIKLLVLDRLIDFEKSKGGFCYLVTAIGKDYAARLSSGYAEEYRTVATLAIESFGNMDERELFELITQRSIQTWSGGNIDD